MSQAPRLKPSNSNPGRSRRGHSPHLPPGARGHQLIRPPQNMRLKIRYRKREADEPDLVEAAEKELESLTEEYAGWLKQDANGLIEAWRCLDANPADPAAFRTFSAQIHLIKGNAPILGCKAAGDIAEPVAALLERCPSLEDFVQVVGLATRGITIAIYEELEPDDPRIAEIRESLHTLVRRWIGRYAPEGMRGANGRPFG